MALAAFDEQRWLSSHLPFSKQVKTPQLSEEGGGGGGILACQWDNNFRTMG